VELRDSFTIQKIVTMIKLRKMRWEGHVAYMIKGKGKVVPVL
jgi:hypothetical protein